MLAESLYVAYRSDRPDEGTVNTVKQKLKENNIDISQLVAASVNNCQGEESSTENGEGNGK
jgi:hypothetical protein